jgi:DNA-binding PadR family transcriptional regulator
MTEKGKGREVYTLTPKGRRVAAALSKGVCNCGLGGFSAHHKVMKDLRSQVDELHRALRKALPELLEEHVHDHEDPDCEDIFTVRGKPRAYWRKLLSEVESR